MDLADVGVHAKRAAGLLVVAYCALYRLGLHV